MRLFNRRNVTVAAIVIGIPALVVAWWLGSPLFLDSEVNEAFPVAAASDQAEEPAPVTSPPVTSPPVTSLGAGDTSTTTASTSASEPTAAPITLLTGEFRDADSSHRGTGTATVYELEDGGTLLRFEEFEVTNGPDLHVYLVPAENAGDEVSVDGYVDLGELKGNIGDQNYEIPPEVDVSEYQSVVIWCEPFAVVFSIASLG